MTPLTPKLASMLLWLAPVALAESIHSGPQPGTPLTPVMVYDGLGERAGKEFDAAAVIGKNPGALLFVHLATRNTYPVIRGIDQLAGRNALMGFKSFTIVLAADRTAAENQVRLRNGLATGGHKFSVTGKFGALKLEHPLVLSLDGLEGPGNYALNRRAVLTLVMTRDGKVHRTHTFTDTGEFDLPLLEELVADVVGPMPEGLADRREIRDRHLPTDTVQLRTLAVRFQAFWGREQRQDHPMLPAIEEITGPLPGPEAALREVVESRLPTDPVELRAMAMRQAEELFHLQTRLNAAKADELRYTTMKTSQIRRDMQRPGMKANTRNRNPSGNQRSSELRPGEQPKSEPRITADAQPKGKAPSDPQLNRLMRSFFRKNNTPQINNDIFADIQARSRVSNELRDEAIAMFQLLFSSQRRYGNDHARALAQQFLEAHRVQFSLSDE